MSEKNHNNNDLLTQFFDHSSNYKNKRNSSYFKFLKLQIQQQISNFNHNLYMTFILKPSRLLVANLSIFLVIVFSLISFGFGLVTQAQSNPGASFLPTDSIDTTRIDDCNLDIAFPKKIQDKDSLIQAFRTDSDDITSNLKAAQFKFSFGVDAHNNNFVNLTNINCFENQNQTPIKLIDADFLDFEPDNRLVLKAEQLDLISAKNRFKWKIFENQNIKNIQVVKAYDSSDSNLAFREYLIFETDNLKYLIFSDSYKFADSTSTTPIDIKNSLDQIPENTNINYNEKNDFVVSRKIQYDENNNYYTEFVGDDQRSNYDKEVREQNNKRLIQFFAPLLFILSVILISANYILDKKLKTKLNLQYKLRAAVAIVGVVYLLFAKVIADFANLVDFLNGFYNRPLDFTVVLVMFSISTVILIFNWKKITKKTRIVDIGFVTVNLIYLLTSYLKANPIYYADGGYDFWNLISIFTFSTIFTLNWIFYSFWNIYLVVKNIFEDKKK